MLCIDLQPAKAFSNIKLMMNDKGMAGAKKRCWPSLWKGKKQVELHYSENNGGSTLKNTYHLKHPNKVITNYLKT